MAWNRKEWEEGLAELAPTPEERKLLIKKYQERVDILGGKA